MYGLDMINTSVLGALGCDMNTFLRYFPVAETMYINQMLSAVKEVPPKYIVLIEQPEQIAEIHTPNTSGYCTVSSGGEVQYYQIE